MMLFLSYLAVVISLPSWTTSQDLPACAASCLQIASPNCDADNNKCFCTTPEWLQNVQSCTQIQCAFDDEQLMLRYVEALCRTVAFEYHVDFKRQSNGSNPILSFSSFARSTSLFTTSTTINRTPTTSRTSSRASSIFFTTSNFGASSTSSPSINRSRSSSVLSRAAIAGIVIGVLFGVAILISLVLFLLFCLKNSRQKAGSGSTVPPSDGKGDAAPGASYYSNPSSHPQYVPMATTSPTPGTAATIPAQSYHNPTVPVPVYANTSPSPQPTQPGVPQYNLPTTVPSYSHQNTPVSELDSQNAHSTPSELSSSGRVIRGNDDNDLFR